MSDVLTPDGRGHIVRSWGGPPLDDITWQTVELVDGRRVEWGEHHEDGVGPVLRVEDPPKGHPYRTSLTVRPMPSNGEANSTTKSKGSEEC